MGERYELSLPYQPLGAPSQAYRDGWDRIFGRPQDKKSVDSHGCMYGNACDHTPDRGCGTCGTTRTGEGGAHPRENPRGAADSGHTPPTTPALGTGLTGEANAPTGFCGACHAERVLRPAALADSFHACARGAAAREREGQARLAELNRGRA